MKPVSGFFYDNEDNVVITPSNEAEEDWLRARRLKEQGTESSLTELSQMENNHLLEVETSDLSVE